MIQVKQFSDIHDTKTLDGLLRMYPENTCRLMFNILSGASYQQLYVAKIDGLVVGAAVLGSMEKAFPLVLEMPPISYIISDVFVDPAHRNQKVGKALCSYMLDEIRDQGGRLVYLFTDYDNKPAHKLYQSLEFTKLERLSSGQIPWFRTISRDKVNYRGTDY